MIDLTNIKNIVFDFGGVLVDLDKDQAVKRFIEIGLKNADKILGTTKQTGIFLEFEEGKLSRDEYYSALKKLIGKDISNEMIDYAWLGFFLPVSQEKIDYLLELGKKYNLYLLSNTNPIIMEWANSPRFTSAGHPLQFYFKKLYFSYELGVIKPNKLVFEKMIADAEIRPEETLFIDDGKSNIETGISLGFKTFQPKAGEDYRKIFLYNKIKQN